MPHAWASDNEVETLGIHTINVSTNSHKQADCTFGEMHSYSAFVYFLKVRRDDVQARIC